MTDREDTSRLEGDAGTAAVEARLDQERPAPAPGFRRDAGHRIESLSARLPGRDTLRLWALLCLIAGVALLSLASLSVAGLGPLAA